MASSEYRVVGRGPGEDALDMEVLPSVIENQPGGRWTHVNAVTYIRTRTERSVAGYTHRILRRRAGSKGPWVEHRAYVMGTDGIVRRT